jgi:hypothetical protein
VEASSGVDVEFVAGVCKGDWWSCFVWPTEGFDGQSDFGCDVC